MPATSDSRQDDGGASRSADAVVRAALAILDESGFPAVTLEGVAARSGVDEPTVREWWPSKGHLVLDAFLSRMKLGAAFPDTGDVIADMRTQMTNGIRLMAGPDLGRHYTALIGEAQHDSELAWALYERFIGPLRDAATDRIKRGQDAGQLRSDIAPELVIDLLYGPVYYQMLVLKARPDGDYVDEVLAAALSGLHP